MVSGLFFLLPVLAAPVAAPAAVTAASPQEVTIVGQRSATSDRTADTTVVAGDKIRESPRATTFEAISQESGGVYVSGSAAGIHGVSSGSSGGVHIRGLGGSPNAQVLVVEDAVADYQGIFGHPLPDAFPPFLIDRVVVVKGGDSVLYGTNALGGAIVIRSRWRDHEGVEMESDSAAGSFGALRETAGVLGRWGQWDVAGAVHAFKTDGHRDGAGGANTIGQTNLRYRITPEFSVTLRNKLMRVEGGDPGPVTHPNTDHWFDVWRERVSLDADLSRGPLRLNVIPYANVGVHRLYDGFYSRDTTAGAKSEIVYRLHKSAELLVGASAEGVDGRVENRITGEAPPVRGNASYSLYHQITFKPFSSLSAVFGMRDMYNTAYGTVVPYKAGLRWSIVDGLYVRARASKSFRQPTIRELYLPYPTANPNLKPEHAITSDVGAGYASEHLDVSVTAYRTQAKDLIKYFGAWPSAEVVNIDQIVVRGLEGRVAVERIGPVGMSLTGNVQEVGRYTRQNPSAKMNFAVDVGHEWGAHFIGAGVSGEWVHGLFMADYSRQPIDDVFVMDAALRYRYTSAARGIGIEPYAYLRNVMDHRYAYIANYTMPGFNVLFGLKLRI
jgi:outer membrane receptor protein involved in Fe transport